MVNLNPNIIRVKHISDKSRLLFFVREVSEEMLDIFVYLSFFYNNF